ncbi:hypothetical protein L2E82_07867 [Cichorium intybus]|uniref:Uncharacterized protein n=1 Tax=Cichorium intybus TaxID=13427 RepID=A0ACB9G6W4_CICIN|nr:hypothetical protein L2E82_07867 [Cichorium intybus]
MGNSKQVFKLIGERWRECRTEIGNTTVAAVLQQSTSKLRSRTIDTRQSASPELDYLVGAVSNPKKPFAPIVGGSKFSSIIGVIESLLSKVNILILGGGMIFAFYKAQGLKVGSSLVQEDKLELATSLLEKASQ